MASKVIKLTNIPVDITADSVLQTFVRNYGVRAMFLDLEPSIIDEFRAGVYERRLEVTGSDEALGKLRDEETFGTVNMYGVKLQSR